MQYHILNRMKRIREMTCWYGTYNKQRILNITFVNVHRILNIILLYIDIFNI